MKPSFAARLVVGLAGASLIAHVVVSVLGPYGIHRDAFLYMATGEHLRLWHMDFPPLIAILSRGIRGLASDSIVALRLVPAAASAGLIVVAGLSARELEGGRFAQGLAALAVLASPLYLRTGALFQPVALDQLWWTLGLFFLLKLTSTGDSRWWIPFGAAAGFGLLTKFSILIFGASVLLALLVTRERRWLATPWPWAAAGLALLVGHPSLVGQLTLDFPLFGQMRDLSDAQLSRVSPPGFLLDQLLAVPGTPIALLGVLAFVGDRRRQDHRLIGVVAIVAFGLVPLANGKSYYIAPIYPVLFGAGAVVLAGVEARPWGAVLRWGAAGHVDHAYAVAEQRGQTVYVCRDPVATLQEFWPTVRGSN